MATAGSLVPTATFMPSFGATHQFSLIFPLTAPNGDGSGSAKNSPQFTASPCISGMLESGSSVRVIFKASSSLERLVISCQLLRAASPAPVPPISTWTMTGQRKEAYKSQEACKGQEVEEGGGRRREGRRAEKGGERRCSRSQPRLGDEAALPLPPLPPATVRSCPTTHTAVSP
jgi:hypothetical protein